MSDDLPEQPDAPERLPSKKEINTEGGAYISGNVTLGPHANFIGRDYIVNNITNIKSVLPPPLDRMVSEAVLRYGGFFLNAVVIFIAWLLLRNWLEPRERYLLAGYLWIIWLVLALGVVWFFQDWRHARNSGASNGSKEAGWVNRQLWPLLITALLMGVSVAWPFLNPITIDDGPFVIALADLGESAGSDTLTPAREGAQISRRIFDKLCELRSANDNVGPAHCPIERNGVIVIQRVGFAGDQAAALRLADRVNADMVLWGSFDQGGAQNMVKLRYTLTQALNPIYDVDRPTIIPVRFSEVQVCTEGDQNNVAADSSQLVNFIWPVTLGFNSYQNRNHKNAKEQLEIALKRLADGENHLLDCQQDAVDQNKALLNFFLGRSNQWLSEYDPDALLKAEEALLAAAAEPAALISLAIVDLQRGRFDESEVKLADAIAQLERLRDDPSQPDTNRVAASYDLGRAHALLQNWEQAALHYADAIERAENSNDAEPFFPGLITLGELVLREETLSTDLSRACGRAGASITSPVSCARDLFEQALELSNPNGINPAWVYRDLGRTAEKENDLDAAERFYLNAVTANPWEPFLYETYLTFIEDRCTRDDACRVDDLFLKVKHLETIAQPLDTAENNTDQRARLDKIYELIDMALERIIS